MKIEHKINKTRHITAALLAVVVCFFIFSCKSKDENLVDVKFDPETMPSMVTDSVVTLISDSGITRYKLVADEWHIFDKAKEPFWFFPEGLYLERFDEDYQHEATILADTAWNFTDKRLWKLKGNVEITNIDGDEFRSDELFWDQSEAKVYSDKYIEIKRSDMELRGYGFTSNQELTVYRIMRPHDGRFPFEEKEEGGTDSEPRTEKTDSEPTEDKSAEINHAEEKLDEGESVAEEEHEEAEPLN